jgi:hypothetical protein
MPLKIGNLSIEKLSGPLISVLAIPKREYNNIPIFLLFGEAHLKIQRGCDDINTKDQFEEILTELNRIAEHKEIHFFTEWFFQNYHNKKIAELKSKESLGNNFISNTEYSSDLQNYIQTNNEFCFFNELKKKDVEKFSRKCKYPNINWQFSDIRQINDENNIFQLITLFDTALGELIKQLLNCSTIGEKEVKLKSQFYTDKRNKECGKQEKSDLIIEDIYEKFKLYFDDLKLTNQAYELDYDNEYLQINNSQIIEHIEYLFDFYNQDFDRLIDKIMEIKRIKKQIKKITNRMKFKSSRGSRSRGSKTRGSKTRGSKTRGSKTRGSRSHSFFKMQIYNYLKTMSDEYKELYKKNVDLLFPLLEKIIIFLKNGKNLEDFKEIMNYIELNGSSIKEYFKKTKNLFLFTPPFSVILDIYFLIRSMKYNNAKLISLLVGYNHVLNMINFFKSNKKMYDIYVFDNNNNSYAKKDYIDYSQCVNMNKALNIDDELIDFDMSILQ